jgi:sec-independent protein translocase protein TatA
MPFGFHPTYLIILLIVVLIIFGPGKLPELGSAIGRGIREFRRESDKIIDDVRSSASDKEPSATASTESGKAEAERKS